MASWRAEENEEVYRLTKIGIIKSVDVQNLIHLLTSQPQEGTRSSSLSTSPLQLSGNSKEQLSHQNVVEMKTRGAVEASRRKDVSAAVGAAGEVLVAEVTSQGPASESSPTVLEATQPSTQEQVVNQRKIKKVFRSRKTVEKTADPSSQNDLNAGSAIVVNLLNTLEPGISTIEEVTLPSTSVRHKKSKSAVPVPEPVNSLLPSTDKAKQFIRAASQDITEGPGHTAKKTTIRAASQDITEGPGVPKKKRKERRAKTTEETSSGLNIPGEHVPVQAPATASTSKVSRKAVSTKDVVAIENDSTGSGLQSEAGELLIEQLKTEKVRVTRLQAKQDQSGFSSVRGRSTGELPDGGTVSKKETVNATRSASMPEKNSSVSTVVDDKVNPKGESEKDGKQTKPLAEILEVSDDDDDTLTPDEVSENENVAENLLDRIPSLNKCITDLVEDAHRDETQEDLQKDTAGQSQDDEDDDTDEVEVEDVVIPNTPAQYPSVPSEFNFTKIASQDMFDTQSNVLPMLALTNEALSDSGPSEVNLHSESINSKKRGREVNLEEEEAENLNGRGDNQSLKGILKHTNDSQSPSDIASLDGVHQPKKKLCFSNRQQVYEVERGSAGRYSPISSQAFSRRLKPSIMRSSKSTKSDNLHPQRSPSKSPIKNTVAPVETRPHFGSKSGIGMLSEATTGRYDSSDHRFSDISRRSHTNRVINFERKELSDKRRPDHREAAEDESEVNLNDVIDPANTFVESQLFSQRAFDEVAYPDLIGCSHPVGIILKKLTTASSQHLLLGALNQIGIKTIGQLCALKKYKVGDLPIYNPRLQTFQSVMKEFAEDRMIRNSNIFDGRSNGLPEASASVLNNNNERSTNPFSLRASQLENGQIIVPPNSIFGSSKTNLPSSSGFHRGNESFRTSGPLSESDFSLLKIGNAHSFANNSNSSVASATSESGHNASDLFNNFTFLNELKDYMKSGNTGAHRLIEFLLTDKACAIKLLKCVFDKEDTSKGLFLQGELQMPKNLIASAFSSLVNDGNEGQSKKLLPFMAEFLDGFHHKLIEKGEQGAEGLNEWCQEFLKSVQHNQVQLAKPSRSREEILNQVIEDLELLHRMGPGVQPSRDVESLRMLGVVTDITRNWLSESNKKELAKKVVDSIETSEYAWQ